MVSESSAGSWLPQSRDVHVNRLFLSQAKLNSFGTMLVPPSQNSDPIYGLLHIYSLSWLGNTVHDMDT